ncbi:extracellular solute-binding protein [Bordetella hinzii]|uniref:Oligopeptide ABC transporter, oligopeptide-binding protein n=1 Tax=Bordetella hinzii OH87 BAL007II TaxID=1331262 RepID=A0ABR4R5T4_9BORD|nr:extracellular solute-binding protein [Bordetella hinzii]KCB26134.1 oligopeptide ABC transporter, oligopeptide-binding protein [Bordetella hinzii OH87 BAL007II]KCB41332.1 oligopeptide ABC transporter, oligopeptide-binding protein [Bordetella hinzii 5132]QDJ40553.1 hypothetical protein CBR70_04200 [Bordetella hinzii]QDJ45113.1 hypothetical protein CBR71_04470 [Bordetella hinzii]QDJ54025.1 hypothetical protein CBR72_03905 [Bordetella hinzii]
MKRYGWAAAALACWSLGNSAQAADLTVTAFGGIWEQNYRKCVIEPFEKQTGKKVDVVLGTPAQWLNQIAANPQKPPIDVVTNTTDTGYEAIRRGLVDAFSDKDVANLADVAPQFKDVTKGHGALYGYGAMGLAYSQKRVKQPPKSWDEFVEGTIRGDWTAAMPGISYPSTTITALWLFVHLYAKDDLDNIAPALQKIKAMHDSGHLIFWNDVNEFLSLMKTGQIDIGMYWDGRAWAFHDEGNPDVLYYNPQPGAPISSSFIQKVKNGSPLAYQFINTVLSPQAQGCWGSAMRYAMSNTKTQYAEAVKDQITPTSQILIAPYEEIGKRAGTWVEQWNKTVR